ncbi:MAG: glutamate 5-kinase [Bacteroidota bacterium]
MDSYKKIVVKLGTNVLTRENGALDITAISHLVDQMAALKQRNIEVILVSSGAVGAGRSAIQLSKDLNKVVQRQVYSAIGQIHLLNLYNSLFSNHQIFCAQVLATKEDFRDRTHYLNMKNCFQALLRDNVIPIVNENDVISVNELMFTDNDELAGLIAALMNADALMILSTVDGILDGHPDQPESKTIPIIDPDDKAIQSFIMPSKSSFGRGGMHTKFSISKKVSGLGITTFIANGKRSNVLLDIVKGDFVGTKILAKKGTSNIKKWMAFNDLSEKGIVYINEGAAKVLTSAEKVSSLLPIGITKIEGTFQKGDIIKIVNESGKSIGIGVAQYGVEKAQSFIGQKSKKALVHYDYLLIDN